MDTEKIGEHWREILKLIGENPSREGLLETPKRIAHMYQELFVGYDTNKEPKFTVFRNEKDNITYD